MHVMGVAVLDPTDAADFDFGRTRDHLIERLPLIPPFRRRLVHVPFGLHYPVWVEDPHFDIDYHLQRAAIPAPGGQRELAEFAASVAGRALDRSRPLWEMYYVEGLEGGKVAVISKVHHSAIDGLSGVDIMAHLFDLDAAPEPRLDVALAPDWQPDHVPNDAELLGYAVMSMVRQPIRMVKTARKVAGSATKIVARVRSTDNKAALPMTAPKLTMNGTITPHRKIAFASVDLADVKRVKDVANVKVNDVVLAIATGALRNYFIDRGELPDRPLVVSIPTSVRTDEQANTMGNRVSSMFASLPVHIADPLERLQHIHEAMLQAKDMHEEIGAQTLQDLAELASPAMLSSVMRLATSLKLTERFATIHNAVISNVPGPPFPLYLAGARLVSMHPLGPIFDGAAMNLTVISYLDAIDFGFIACRELVPDLEALSAYVPDALRELSKLVDAITAPTPSAPATTRKKKVASVAPVVADPPIVAKSAGAKPAVTAPESAVAKRANGLSRVAPRSAPKG